MVEPVSYRDFRTGLTYSAVYYMIWPRKHKRRHGVLGAWRQIKQEMYSEYIDSFEQQVKSFTGEPNDQAGIMRQEQATDGRTIERIQSE